MAREERDPYDAADQPRSRTERLPGAGSAADGSEPINPGWRQRTTRPPGRSPRTAQPLPTSSQDFVFWLQYGGWRFVLAAAGLVAVVAFAIVLTSQPPDSVDPFVQPTLTGVNEAIIVQTRLPTVTAAPALPTSSPALAGAKFRVAGTGPEGLFLRPGANRDQPPITTLVEGSEVTVVGEDKSQPDGVWKNVRDAQGNTGWAFGEFLKPVGP